MIIHVDGVERIFPTQLLNVVSHESELGNI